MWVIIIKDEALMPKKWSINSTCYDLFLDQNAIIQPWEIKILWTWIKTNFASKIYARSSLAIKKQLMLPNSVWIIDSDYRWEIKVALYNFWNEAVSLKRLERLAQIECEDFKFIVDKKLYENWEKLEISNRWNWWFWSSWGYS